MLEQWLKTLEEKEKGLIQETQKLSINSKTITLAEREIKVNAQSCRNYLKRLSNETKFPLVGDLQEVKEIYCKNENEHYRFLTNHISMHLAKMDNVLTQLREGSFEPEFARLY